jgi:hypothetical protein
VEVDWGDDPGWTGGGKRPSNPNTLPLTPEALSQVQHHVPETNHSDPDVSLVTELPVERLVGGGSSPALTCVAKRSNQKQLQVLKR